MNLTKLYLAALLSIGMFLSNIVFALGPCEKIKTDKLAFLPTLAQCGGKAAVVLSGNYAGSFSVVTRDCNNNDRDPCYKHLGEKSCASNYSSPFKALKRISADVTVNGEARRASIFCFRESGNSQIYKDLVRRITVKFKNPVKSEKDLKRFCLPNRSVPTADVVVTKVISTKNIGSTGYNAACPTQEYLACDTSYCSICEATTICGK